MIAASRTLVVAIGLAAAGCSAPTVDLAKQLEIAETATGWVDAGQVNGSNKLVPAITFRLKNRSGQELKVLKVNAVFRQLGEQGEEWGAGYKEISGSSGLEPGQETDQIRLISPKGYTAPQPRADMLVNPAFVDAKVDLYAKYSSQQWKRIAEVPVARQIVTY